MAGPASARRERLLGQFRRKLEGLSADEIQEMLDRRRIRSSERIAVAWEILNQRGRPKAARAAAVAAGTGLAQMAARAGNGAKAGPEGRSDGEETAATAEAKAAREAAPIARQIGRVLGIGLGVASIAALAIFAIRRSEGLLRPARPNGARAHRFRATRP